MNLRACLGQHTRVRKLHASDRRIIIFTLDALADLSPGRTFGDTLVLPEAVSTRDRVHLADDVREP